MWGVSTRFQAVAGGSRALQGPPRGSRGLQGPSGEGARPQGEQRGLLKGSERAEAGCLGE